MTVDILESQMSEDAARRITERIRIVAVTFAESWQKLIDLVQEAKEGHAHIALGYASWPAYLSEVLGEEPMRLARDERRVMVQLLAAEGMSTRAIAPIVGARSHMTVSNDLKALGVQECTPAPVAGLDGKTYTRKPSAPTPDEPIEFPVINAQPYQHIEKAGHRADPITKQYTSAIVQLNEALETLQRLHRNDRFKANKNQIASTHGNDLARTISELSDLLADINN